MSSTLPSYDSSDEEDYIDMDLSSSPHSTEFEFQMCFISNDENSPADELFYKGKLLPLHLSPRLKMIQTSNTPSTTPVDESCNISPSESCRDSCELNLDDDYFFEWSTELSSFIHSNRSKKSWSKKLKFVKNSIPIGHKLKAYLKSLFSKSDESSCAKAAACNVEPENLSKNQKPFTDTIMKSIEKEGIHVHRRSSFSGAIKNKCLSSSSSSSCASSLSSSCSFNSNAFNGFHFLKRSSSATEIDVSIDAAIAHCKKSQLLFDSRSTSGFSSFPGIPAAKNQQRPDVCSI
ncbi:putative membrane-associated kinase regulator 3 [Abeliophyllum distichum]|uniref:Membrane-associated kinase regulator 3 n=1 Tax=Abeliophyllum distichum TaxID=126358 RepID=A0ABD1RA59_9LAMI